MVWGQFEAKRQLEYIRSVAAPRNQNSFLINNFQDKQRYGERACYQTATQLV